jgi:hypothetical protein
MEPLRSVDALEKEACTRPLGALMKSMDALGARSAGTDPGRLPTTFGSVLLVVSMSLYEYDATALGPSAGSNEVEWVP